MREEHEHHGFGCRQRQRVFWKAGRKTDIQESARAVCAYQRVEMSAFQRSDVGQETRDKTWCESRFSYLTPNLKKAGREHSPGPSGPSSGTCVLPDLSPTRLHGLVCMCGVCMYVCVWSQLSPPSPGRRRATWNQLALGGLCQGGLMRERAGLSFILLRVFSSGSLK